MRLNDTFLGVQYEIQPKLKRFYLQSHLDESMRPEIELQSLIAMGNPNIIYTGHDKPWEMRVQIANTLVQPAQKKYYLTESVQELASKIKIDKIDLKWFKQVENKSVIYILNKEEFYRFNKTDDRINVLHYRHLQTQIVYDCYSIILNDGILAMMPSQDKNLGERFIKLLLYMEMGEITLHTVKPNGKVVFGKKGDEKIKNDTGLEVQLVNTTWNKLIVVEGGFTVRQHLRVQPCGVGRRDYKLVWVREYTKGSYVRNAGRLKDEKI